MRMFVSFCAQGLSRCARFFTAKGPLRKILFLLFVFVVYDIFVVKSPHVFFSNIVGVRYFVNYVVSLLVLTIFILLMDLVFRGRWLAKSLVSLLIFIPLGIQTAHYAFYGMPLSTYGIRFFFRDPQLTMQLGSENINFVKVSLYAIFCIFVTWIFALDARRGKPVRFKYLKLGSYLTILAPLVVLCGVNWYLILDYQNSMVSVYAAVPETLRSSYFRILKANKPKIVLPVTEKSLPNVVWIIGESAAKSHMSLYGYSRQTTPGLDALRDSGDLFAFQNVVSIGPHTIISVPYMMVGLQRIDPQGLIYSKPNIFEYARERHYETSFISAQDLRWRNFDQLVGGPGAVDFFRSGPDFSPSVSVSQGAPDMEVLHRAILPRLAQAKPPFLLVAHMDGSHYPYQKHSPQEYKKFLPEESPNSVNAYDNTFLYSDAYLTELIRAARAKDPNVWIFYSTDHGQSVALADAVASSQSDHTSFVFNQGYNKDIIHNAFFVVPPPAARKSIEEKTRAPVAQADIFATILDLMDIHTLASDIDGLSLLGSIPNQRLRVSTGFVAPNDNVPEAEVTDPSGTTSIFVDFGRKTVNYNDGRGIVEYARAPVEIQNLFKAYLPSSY